ncbi:hypothetical protein CJF32_00006601 [Rutstroemia sp. NJR-2017a WRK4]|nr:hypothetical protein CJF32_00006601 [Rutstroemia sp. NJR-2017a WRK4]
MVVGPGGYIQWDEFDRLRSIAEGPNGDQSPYVAKVLTLMQEIRDHSRWIERLPELFKQFGLENIGNEFAFEQPWQSKMASDMSCAVAHEMENNGSPFLTEKIKTLGVSVPLAYSEVSKGARVVQPFCVAVGRKRKQNDPSNTE